MIDSKEAYAHSVEFDAREVYYPKKRPGYTAWANLFPFGNGDLGIAFNEIRRGRNPQFEPPSLEFIEAMQLPYRVAPDAMPATNQNLINEYVCLKSIDQGVTWHETGRCAVDTRHYWHVGFPDGRIVRMIGTQQYRYTQGNDRHCTIVEESLDGGNTWKELSRIMEGSFFYSHKFKKLQNGTIIAAGPVCLTFGPGGTSSGRNTSMPGQIKPHQSAFLVSEDGGHSWDGPHYILPGIDASEPDFVEIEKGKLLFINSTVQGGHAVRQIVRRNSTGWVNSPLMEIHRGIPEGANMQGGITPEAVTIMDDGLIVGVRRMGGYTCSRDFGENWYEIDGPEHCNYQPIIEALPDGQVMSVWHLGGDTRFGEIDMFIGTHSFRVESDVPQPAALSLERELSADGGQYVNAFEARLTTGDTPLPGREIRMHVKSIWTPQPEGIRNIIDILESPDLRTAVTDENGVARFALKDKDRIRDIHHGYEITVSFTPDEGDSAAACRGPQLTVYPSTPSRYDTAPYPIYINHNMIMITPKTAEQYPDLIKVVSAFSVPNPDSTLDRWTEVAGSKERAIELLAFFVTHGIIFSDEQGIYHWYRAVHSGREGEPWIKGAQVCDLEEYCV
jgi:hypothetical protein